MRDSTRGASFSATRASLPCVNPRAVYAAGMLATEATIESALGDLQELPTPVSSWRVEIGLDASDQRAVWVWAMLDDEEVDIDTGEQLRDVVREAVQRETGDEHWVYIRFRSASEPDPEA